MLSSLSILATEPLTLAGVLDGAVRGAIIGGLIGLVVGIIMHFAKKKRPADSETHANARKFRRNPTDDESSLD